MVSSICRLILLSTIRRIGKLTARGNGKHVAPVNCKSESSSKISGDPHVMRMLVIGAGLPGSACAYDWLQNPELKEVRVAGLDTGRRPLFLAPYSGERLI